MIKSPIEFHCDGCPRTMRVEASGEFRVPDLGALGSLYGWRHFLRGPLVCPVCAENQEILDRLKRTWAAAVDGNGNWNGNEFIAPPRTMGNAPMIPALQNPALPQKKRRRSDEEIQAALAAHDGNKFAAARSMGISVPNIYRRLRQLRPMNSSPPECRNGNTTTSHT